MSTARLRILADDPVFIGIEAALSQGERFDESPINGGDTLVVYAHALTGGQTRRSRNGGLVQLEELVATGAAPAEMLVLGWLAPDSYGEFAYLVEPRALPFQRLPINRLVPGEVRQGLWLALSQTARMRRLVASVERFLGVAAMHHGAEHQGRVPNDELWQPTLRTLCEAAETGRLPHDTRCEDLTNWVHTLERPADRLRAEVEREPCGLSDLTEVLHVLQAELATYHALAKELCASPSPIPAETVSRAKRTIPRISSYIASIIRDCHDWKARL